MTLHCQSPSGCRAGLGNSNNGIGSCSVTLHTTIYLQHRQNFNASIGLNTNSTTTNFVYV